MQPPLLLRSKYNIQEEFIIRQFYFHKTYSDVIGGFTNAEAGAFIKKLCKFMFLDEKLQANAKDKVTSILILLSDGLTEDKNGTCITRSKGKRFTFKSVYANVFYSLNDTNAGILIKAVCNFMFGGDEIHSEELGKVAGYFYLLKGELIKSKRKAESGSKEKFTLEKIYADFPNIQNPLARSSNLFKGVKMQNVYEFINTHPEEQTRDMYRAMCNFLDEQQRNYRR